jgi:glycosyltransferase involved in cell wall biosynthesis
MRAAPLRIAFVSQYAWSLFDRSHAQGYGGAELQMYLLAGELAKDPGFDVSFLVQDEGQPRSANVGGVEVSSYRRPLREARWARWLRWPLVLVSAFLAMRRLRADALVVSPASYLLAVAVSARGVSRRTRVLYRVASDADLDGTILAMPAERRLFLFGERRVDRLIARNSAQRERFAAGFGRPVSVLANGFPTPDEPPPDAAKRHVLWVASAQRLKRPELFLRIAKRLPGEQFVMVMPCSDPEVFDRTRSDAATVPNLRVLESVPLDEIQQLFDTAKIFVNTSTVEGHPNTFVQAAIGATPILSLDVDPGGSLTDNGYGICEHGDLGALVSDLSRLLDDADARRAMGLLGFEHARRENDLVAVAASLKEIVRETVNG